MKVRAVEGNGGFDPPRKTKRQEAGNFGLHSSVCVGLVWKILGVIRHHDDTIAF